MAPRSNSYLNANDRLNGQLPELIATLRAEGRSWAAIAAELLVTAGIRVTGETVQNWAEQLQAEADKAAS